MLQSLLEHLVNKINFFSASLPEVYFLIRNQWGVVVSVAGRTRIEETSINIERPILGRMDTISFH